MVTLAAGISLDELDDFVSRVRAYPVTVRQLLGLARQTRAPGSVIKFYETFSADQVFMDKDDLISRTEQVEMLRRQSGETPSELELATEED